MNQHAILKAVSQKLNQTPVDELPKTVGTLATAIVDSCDAIRDTQQGQQQGAIALHRLKTRVSALLQDRTLNGRVSGIIIAKAVIEAGGDSVLSESANWVRQLLSCLNKPDPPEVTRTCILTLTRTFLLSSTHPPSIAQVATPNLPAFILACLNALKGQTKGTPAATVSPDALLTSTVLRCFHSLIKPFPTVFRPQLSGIRLLCLDVLSNEIHDSCLDSLATELLARLHFAVPKNTIGAEWLQTCLRVIDDAHNTADLVFRAVLEHWKSSTSRISQTTKQQRSCPGVESNAKDATGLDEWHGVAEGSRRLTTHLLLLRKLLCTMHTQSFPIPVTEVLDLTLRLSSITIPGSKSLRVNSEVSQDERDELWLYLPQIHVATIDFLATLVHAFGQSLNPVVLRMTYQTWDIFESEYPCQGVRTSTYRCVHQLLDSKLLMPTKDDLQVWTLLIEQCCRDIRLHYGLEKEQNRAQINVKNGSSDLSLLSAIKISTAVPTTSIKQAPDTPVSQAAKLLLPALIQYFPHTLFPSSLRAQLDSTAILTNNHDAILASVLYPPRGRSKDKSPLPSIIPHFARTEGNSLAKEALLRPRMPVMGTLNTHVASLGEPKEDAEEVQAEVSADAHFDDAATATTSALDALNVPAKRDLTSVLEQSAEEQITNGELSIDTQSMIPVEEIVSAVKRPRLDVHEERVVETHIESVSTAEPISVPAKVIVAETISRIQPVASAPPSAHTRAEEMGKAPAVEHKPELRNYPEGLEENASSDESDAPVIEGTLAWELSEDEDEDEDIPMRSS